MTFDELVNKEFAFFGVDSNSFKLGDTVFEALEDENDGYRSYLRSVEIKDPKGLIFFNQPLATVKLESVGDKGDSFSGYHLVDLIDGHIWLRLGTDAYDDYYPTFLFEYSPKST